MLQSPLILAFAAILGLIVGSFLNVVIYRLPLMLDKGWRRDCHLFLGLEDPEDEAPDLGLLLPHSFCPHCRAPIRPWENVPVISYLLLRGRCRACREPIALRYPFIETLTAGVSMAVAWKFGCSWSCGEALILTWMLIVLGAIDLDRQLLPDAITLPGLWLGLLFSLFGGLSAPRASIVGAIVGYLALWLVYQLFRLATGKEGIGFGDFKLLSLLGAWLGWQAVPVIVLISSTLGALVGVALIILGTHDRSKPLPFGPYLAAAGFIHLLWGHELIAFYLDWFQVVG